ncbi:Outer membrane porin protein 32 [Paraburkholderia hiiakae]|uniref:Outer membrane porin protein 32 n=1 Tax=Paraburkholderia hiiakae TaxID=1081782 RepID=A0ABN7IH66_9BURK|nr:porin [Paraburkholderia hiiakae]CAD6559390.1 Outer membrane porin protein 32 [Paraburkholderia hiiakae]
MQKKLVKTALAGSALCFAVAAQAQSSVTLYGIVDAGLLYLSKTRDATGGNGGKFFGFTDSGQMPSLFGLKGDEELGGGLHAEFKLESGINIANGGFNDSNGNFFGRQAWVGLRGNFGTVRAGLQYSPFFDAVYALDPRNMSQLGSSLVPFINNTVVTGVFSANAVTYTSPVLAGFQGSLMYALGGVAGDFQAGRVYSANLSYHWSGLGVFAAYYNGNEGPSVSPLPSTLGMIGRTLGASYTFGSATAKGSFTNYKMAGSGINNDVWNGGLDYQATPMIDLNGGVWYMVNRNDTSSKSLMGALGVNYSLSKATGLYAQVGVVNNKGSQNLGLEIGDGGNTPSSLYAPPGTTVGVDIGIHHVF